MKKKLTKEQKLKARIIELEEEVKSSKEDRRYYRDFYDQIKSLFDEKDQWNRDVQSELIEKVTRFKYEADAYIERNEGIVRAESIRADRLHHIIDALINPEILEKKYSQNQSDMGERL